MDPVNRFNFSRETHKDKRHQGTETSPSVAVARLEPRSCSSWAGLLCGGSYPAGPVLMSPLSLLLQSVQSRFSLTGPPARVTRPSSPQGVQAAQGSYPRLQGPRVGPLDATCESCALLLSCLPAGVVSSMSAPPYTHSWGPSFGVGTKAVSPVYSTQHPASSKGKWPRLVSRAQLPPCRWEEDGVSGWP